ncbi:Anthranilate phosphoribosyltransferase [Spirochaeta thermophila DSM 6578]|uniref:Anthranilate phosphoribosyltransferase n=1 Tax=Winmispira thermophila (strain ATCC 700085 / DSM 6578 / Z-1203) TaxID=869211 RepID=G0GCN4_WINT7|nr:bifunctional anthranilate synthase component II/anthranilate phosphoribosyltransferase [Spirochaeta thermophila]AEJ60453.1 Anthranilate phosphoribosyltransferase [Spirochaeta thermophila DSM 6578]
MYLLIDNYDSFTYNIYQYLCELAEEPVRVVRNDEITVEEVEALHPRGIIISPGPGRPEDAGISLEVIRRFAGKVPILGVCLGHQCIGQAFGARIVQAKRIMHGKTDTVHLDGKGIFRMLPRTLTCVRYHSLVIDEESLPPEFEVTARSSDGEIMGVRHREWVLEGVQFHPESIATEEGKRMLANFLSYKREPFDYRGFLSRLLEGEDASREEAEEFMDELTSGNLTPAQIAGALVALNAKGFAPQEVAGCAAVLKRKAVPFPAEGAFLDTCGTGGDGLGTFNISSCAALVAAACGVPVAKHGNRAVSSKSGSADFYAALGIPVDLPPDVAARMLEQEGFVFLFAPRYHGAMKYAAGPRRELGIKTIMNFVGPLSNPAGAVYQLVGVFSRDYLSLMAEAALQLGVRRVMAVHGEDGQDEVSVTGRTFYVYLDAEGRREEGVFEPEDLGVGRYPLEEVLGGTPEENVEEARRVFAGEGRPALRDAVAANAGVALYVAGAVSSPSEGVGTALDVLSSGKVGELVERLVSHGKERV